MCKDVQDVNVDTLGLTQCSRSGVHRWRHGSLRSFRFLWHEYEGWGLHHYAFNSLFGHYNVGFRL